LNVADRTQEYARRLLLQKMEELSEDRYAAGWMLDIEYDLWDAVVCNAPGYYGLDEQERADLSQLAADAGGWFALNRQSKKVEFVEQQAWGAMFKEKRPSLEDLHAMKLRPPNGMTVEEMLDDTRGEE
jgi:hypothetical protein